MVEASFCKTAEWASREYWMSLTDLTLRIHVGEMVLEANCRQEYSKMAIIIPQTRYQVFGDILSS